MFEFLEVLDVDKGLAILRIGLGLWWLKSTFHKPYPEFLLTMSDWVIALVDNHPLPFLAKPIGKMVDKNRGWFPHLTVLGEFAVGVGLTLGLFTPLSLIVALLLNFNYIFMAGVRPTKDLNVNKGYKVEQGQNWNMIVPEVVLLLTGAWTTWSLDAVLGLF
ncbi:MAG: hypothetical protein N2D54_02745 [Chloroflexota bacterium]